MIKKLKVIGGFISLLAIILIISGCSSGTLNEIGQDHDELEDDKIFITSISKAGELIVGETLEAIVEPKDATVDYQWMIVDSLGGLPLNIVGATEKSYTVISSDEGKYISVHVTGKGDYTAELISGQEGPILPAVTPAEYFAFDSSTKTITQYYPSGPDGDLPEILNPHIPATIAGVPVETIGDSAFTEAGTYASLGITGVIFPEGLKEIGADAFSFNGELTSLIIPESVQTIGFYAFGGNKLESVIISDNVTSIGGYAFAHNNLTSFKIPDSLTEIANGIFEENNLEQITLPDGITRIGRHAFYRNQLKEVIIPDGVTEIGGSAFRSNKLETLILGKSVETIGNTSYNRTFRDNNLTTITIPASVKNLADYSFYSNNLTEITMEGSETTIGDFLLHGVVAGTGNEFKNAYYSGGAGTYTGTQEGDWTKVD